MARAEDSQQMMEAMLAKYELMKAKLDSTKESRSHVGHMRNKSATGTNWSRRIKYYIFWHMNRIKRSGYAQKSLLQHALAVDFLLALCTSAAIVKLQ